jgi:hypothetical protein
MRSRNHSAQAGTNLNLGRATWPPVEKDVTRAGAGITYTPSCGAFCVQGKI